MAFTLQARQYKSLARLDWTAEGVCALVGPNGSGKTTALWTPEVLRIAFESDLVQALNYVGGTASVVRRFDAPPAEATEVCFRVGGLAWFVRPEPASRVWERIFDGPELLVSREPGSDSITVGSSLIGSKSFHSGDNLALRRAAGADTGIADRIAPLVQAVRSYRVHGDYELRHLREFGSTQSTDGRLDASGKNAFAVLHRWRTRSDDTHRWDFVVGHLRDAYPDWFREFDFEPAGNVISVVVRTPGRHQLRPNDWPNGFFSMLLSLCAVAGTDRGGIVALDEPETALHPALIRFSVDAYRDWAVRHDVTVILATHSPVLLDCFTEQPERVFVMDPEASTLPVALDTLRTRDWLRHFSLGDLYEREKFGSRAGVPGA